MIEYGHLFPDQSVQGSDGLAHPLWDWRQKSHVVLTVDPQSDAKGREALIKEVKATAKTWDWLRVVFLWQTVSSEHTPPGVYLIDRYGRFRKMFPLKGWTLDDIEKEWIYHEAKFC